MRRNATRLPRRSLLLYVGVVSVTGQLGCSSEPVSCASLEGLTEEEKQSREALRYIDVSPNREKICKDCQQWVPPAERGACGGCKVMKGPVHPRGYCQVYARAG